MRTEEAEVIGAILAEYSDLSPMVELGAESADFRAKRKPHIERAVHGPLARRGIRPVTSDLVDGPGIDISGDIFDPGVQDQLKAVGAKSLMCFNILEHVKDPKGFAEICNEIVKPGGVVFVSVPYKYPFHANPIDTMFRPTPEEIAALFPGYTLERAQIVRAGSHWDDLKSLRGVARFVRGLVLPVSLTSWRTAVHNLLWLFRPYEISIAALRKPA